MKLLALSAGASRGHWSGYGLALATFVAALLIRLALHDGLPPGYPFLTFFPAVIMTAFFGGVRPGILCAILSGLAAWYLFIPPHDSLALSGQTALALAFYVFNVTIPIALIHAMNIAAERFRAERAVSAGLLEQQRTMFQELQHRVANNMAFVASLLALSRRRAAGDPTQAMRALEEAQTRVETMSRIHRRLYDPASVNLPVGQYFQELCTDLLDATGAKNIVCLVDVPAVTLDIKRLVTLSLLLAEVVTNSLKHAFDEGQTGTIAINLERLDADRFALTIKDNGRGIPADYDPKKSKSLGLRIIQSLTAQLGGEVTFAGEKGVGTTTRLTFAS